jgi:hypothetical protein
MPAVMRLGGWRRLSTVARCTYMNGPDAGRGARSVLATLQAVGGWVGTLIHPPR